MRSRWTDSAVSTAHRSTSRVTNVDPWRTPAKPPTTTKSTPESASFCRRRPRLCMELAAGRTQRRDQFQGGIVLSNAFLKRERKADLQQRQVEPSLDGLANGFVGRRHRSGSVVGFRSRAKTIRNAIPLVWMPRTNFHLRASGTAGEGVASLRPLRNPRTADSSPDSCRASPGRCPPSAR